MATPIQRAGTVLRYVAPIVVLSVAVLAAKALIDARKAPPKVERPARVLPVEVAKARLLAAPPTYEAYGVVGALRELTIRPVVGGPVVTLHPNMIEGGLVKKGEVLFGVDPRDYEFAEAAARANLLIAEADLAIEQGTAAVAASEWSLLEGTVESTSAGKSLALREPYLAKQSAVVEAAKAQLEQAKLNLERASIQAPFDAVILSESLELGAQVTAGSEVARIVATEAFLLEVNIPSERTTALDFSGTPVTIHVSDGVDAQSREGELLRLAAAVDPAGRMARAQVAVLDPMGGKSPLLLGAYVRVDVPLLASPDALSIPRSALREGDIVWLAKDGEELVFQPVQVALRRNDDVVIRAGLEPGQEVITSAIAVPVPGAALRVIEKDDQPATASKDLSNGGLDQ